MKRAKIFIILLFVLMTVTILNGKNFLWEVQNGKNKAFILGSLHIMPEDVYPLDEKIEKAFEEADYLVVEVDATKIDQKEMTDLISKNAGYENGKSLKTELPEELYKSVSEKFGKLGVPMTKIDIYKPWFVSMNLGLLCLQKLNITAGQGIDVHFLSKEKVSNKKIIELETANAQIEMLSSNPEKAQIDYLQYSIDDYEKCATIYENMLEAWKLGDTTGLYKVTKKKMLALEKELPGMINFYNKMFTERDFNMIKKIDNLLNNGEDKVYFIIIGAVHLVGDDGILNLLNKKGYKTIQQ